MKIQDWFKQAEMQLNKAGIDSARLDTLILLEDELAKDRGWLLAHPEVEISKTQQKRLSSKVKKRENHLPLAYVRGFTEFYGRKFLINHHVLEPRPESETMITLLKTLPCHKTSISRVAPWKIADVGCGSGALGITAKLELPDAQVDLYDIDAGALAVARHNQVLHELHLHTRKSNLLSRQVRPYDVILANLPYVPDNYKINQAAAMEPKIAIFGGQDGLEVYRRFFTQLEHFTWKPKFILCESMPLQHQALAAIARESGFELCESEGFIQAFINEH